MVSACLPWLERGKIYKELPLGIPRCLTAKIGPRVMAEDFGVIRISPFLSAMQPSQVQIVNN
jgi:hypothetical protein